MPTLTDVKTWSQKLANLKGSRKKVNGVVYNVAKLIDQIFKDKEYQIDCSNANVDPHSRLNREFEYGTLSASHLMKILEYFPNKKDWETTSIQNLYYETMRKVKQKQINQEAVRKNNQRTRQISRKTFKEPHSATMNAMKIIPENDLHKFTVKTMKQTASLQELLDCAVKVIQDNDLVDKCPKKLKDFIQN